MARRGGFNLAEKDRRGRQLRLILLSPVQSKRGTEHVLVLLPKGLRKGGIGDRTSITQLVFHNARKNQNISNGIENSL